MAKRLSSPHLVLLAVAFASDSNVPALRALILFAPELFKPELILRVLLSFLPESLDPDAYTPLLNEVCFDDASQADDTQITTENRDVRFDRGPVEGLSEKEARERLQKLHLKRLHPKSTKSNQDGILQLAPKQPLVLFLIQRAHMIEKETGLLTLVPELVEPFLERSAYLRTWYASTILPLLRFEYEYYREDGPTIDLETFEGFEGAAGVNVLMSRSTLASREGSGSADSVGRDMRGMVGPWTYGSTQRKRRKLGDRTIPRSVEKVPKAPTTGHVEKQDSKPHDTSTDLDEAQLEPNDQLEDWQHTFRWMVTSAVDNFTLAVQIIEGWRGPNDVDLQDLDPNFIAPTNDQVQSQLHLQYCQTALAAIYAVESDSFHTVQDTYKILSIVAEMMGYPAPTPLGTDVTLIPTLEQQTGDPTQPLEQYHQSYLQFNELLKTPQPLTMPTMEAYALLHLLIHSAHVLTGLGFSGSIAQVAKLCFHGDKVDLQRLLQRILERLSTTSKLSEDRWVEVRRQLLWLWNWNTSDRYGSATQPSQGVFRRLSRTSIECDILKAIGNDGQFNLVRSIYLQPEGSENPLPLEDVESNIIKLFDAHYAAATNGNKTRGFMKKGSDVLSAFRAAFPSSTSFGQASALLSATHALSFYALTLEAGQPTAPLRIRDFDEPLSLIRTVLSQNTKSYTKLDDLISIANNLVIAKPAAFMSSTSNSPYSDSANDLARSEAVRQKHATRVVTGMAIEAALEEDDFETAYSYVVNRLSLSSASQSQAVEKGDVPDDTLWRAAYLAGRHRAPLSAKGDGHERARRLEQRMDLLSRALSLAPDSALAEILAAWRRCEEELLTTLQEEAQAEAEADEIADKRLSGMRAPGSDELPGAFGTDQPALVQGQARRKEVGRASRADGEAPMGLFDVARGAAEAFGRMGGKQHQQQKTAGGARASGEHMTEDTEEEGKDRVRKRDMVANAVTGGMARGIGWVLGATPVSEGDRKEG